MTNINNIDTEFLKYINLDLINKTTFDYIEPNMSTNLSNFTISSPGIHHITSVMGNKESQKPQALTPNNVITIKEGIQATIVYHQIGYNAFSNETTQIIMEKDANLEWICIQDYQPETIQFQSIQCELDTNSNLNIFTYTDSGQLIRNFYEINIRGIEANCNITGLSLLSKNTALYNQVIANHHVGNATSNQLFKNILTDESKAEYTGCVYVARNAQKTLSNQLNNNLVLSEKSTAYSRPQLKILADDVKCNHGATIGQLEEEELFYLCSRGLSQSQSKQLLLNGFIHHALDQVVLNEAKQLLNPKISNFLST